MSRVSGDMRDETEVARSSSKVDLLKDLRNEVDQLRLENKDLARQLHANRYVAKHRMQREITELRSNIIRLERETASIRERVDSRKVQIEAQEEMVRAKLEEAHEVQLQSEKVNDRIQEITAELETSERTCEQTRVDLDQKRKVIDTVKERIRKVKEGRDEETALTTELNEALCKTNSDIRKLQEHHSQQLTELKRCEDSEENLDQELLKIHEDIRWLKQKIKDNDDDNKKVEVEITKTVAQIKLSKENQLTKSAQCSAILALLQQRPDANKLSQTAPVAIGNQSGGSVDVFETAAHNSNRERGTIVRVHGVGGNAKQKFGKDLEVRATSYSRHVNLNIKLNR